jgi:hypothetical protein
MVPPHRKGKVERDVGHAKNTPLREDDGLLG